MAIGRVENEDFDAERARSWFQKSRGAPFYQLSCLRRGPFDVCSG